MLVGSKELIHKAKWIRKSLGGGMRQAGVIAAAGIFALENNVTRLCDDHARAQCLAEGLQTAGYPTPDPASNMIYVEVRDGQQAQDVLEEHGVRCFAVGPTTLRLVTHLDVDDTGIEHAISVFGDLASSLAPQ